MTLQGRPWGRPGRAGSPLGGILVLLAGLAAALAGGCSRPALAPEDQPAALVDFRPTLSVQPLWAAQVGKGVGRQFLKLGPLVDGERVYAANRKGRVSAFATDTGRRIWTVGLDRPISGGPGDGGDLLLFGGVAEVIAVDKADGRVRWRAPVSSEVLAAPVRGGDVVVARTVDGALFGLAAGDGHRLWRVKRDVPALSLRGIGIPVVVGDRVVAGFADGHALAVGLRDGRLLWETVVAEPRGRTELERMVDVDGHLRVVDGVVYAASMRERTAALTLGTGQVIWSRELPSFTGLTGRGDDLYLPDTHGDLWALSRGGGGTLWKQDALHGRGLTAPALQGQSVVVGDFEGYLHWVAREDGRLLARARVEEPDYYFPVKEPEYPDDYPEDRGILATPVVVGDRVYAMDKRGVLNVYRVTPLQDTH